MAKGTWSPERRAKQEATMAAKKANGASVPNKQYFAPEPERLSGAPVVAAYERPRQRVIPKGDGFHYTICEKKPTTFDLDYQGDKLARRGDELCPDLGTKEFDVYRLPMEDYRAFKAKNGQTSALGANAPMDFQPEAGRVTKNTIDVSDLDTTKIEIVSGQAPPSN